MLEITIPANECWDERTQTFVIIKEQTLRLEHSLVSLSKWESKWCKSFFAREDKTYEETIDYIRCMTLNTYVEPDVYNYLTDENIKQIGDYISAPMTATTYSDNKKGGSRERQKWHLNRLLTLIRVCEIKNQPPKKMSKSQIASRNAALNAARRKQLNTTG